MTKRQIKECAEQFRDGLLAGRSSDGMCFAICAALGGWLNALGVPTEIVEAEFPDTNHVWLQLSDGTILDPTADQFGLDYVYLGPLPASYKKRTARLQRVPVRS